MESSTNMTTPSVVNSTIWGNAAAGLNTQGLKQQFRNNIVVSNGLGITATRIEGTPTLAYNNVWGNGTNWFGAAAPYETAAGNSSVDPLFVDPSAGDFHLRSQVGRYDAATGAWVRDTVASPCIDAGDPGSSIGNEPEPNGGRINMGAYGGTAFASKSLPRLTIVRYAATQDVVLSWGCLPSETYQVLHSPWVTGPWSDDLPGSQLTAGTSQTSLTFTNQSASALTNRFYRVRWNTP
jgi:hypothetical protein